MTVVANPRQFKVPDWFLNRKKDYKDGRFSQVVSNALDMKLRDDLERLKKIRSVYYHVFLLLLLMLCCYMMLACTHIYCHSIVEIISCIFLFVSAVHVFLFIIVHSLCLCGENLFIVVRNCYLLFTQNALVIRRPVLLLRSLHDTKPLCYPGTTVVCVTTGASVSVASTPRPPGDVERPSVCQRRDKLLEAYWHCLEYADICALLCCRMFIICRIDEQFRFTRLLYIVAIFCCLCSKLVELNVL
jgi:hypothetical protein